MKSKQEGFILFDAYVGLVLLILVMSTLLPVIIQYKIEQSVLVERVDHYHFLYNTIQTIKVTDLPLSMTRKLNEKIVEIDFYILNNQIIGKGTWTNAKKHPEEIFVYFQLSE
ncbi:hypothetical protein [Amphibacillus cookii]|uniref:hypothetical protein n=1 Tax=Amphibacillus cookii TaxID=767787 RepID=UPI00195EBC27|nr:hypothetical protein [Amphibacillus cookii]MBM7542411.1 hypothetical protein [Amphibacillus cookii]